MTTAHIVHLGEITKEGYVTVCTNEPYNVIDLAGEYVLCEECRTYGWYR